MQVRQNGRGDFKTLTEAINSVPVGNKERVIIKLGHGEYKRRLRSIETSLSSHCTVIQMQCPC